MGDDPDLDVGGLKLRTEYKITCVLVVSFVFVSRVCWISRLRVLRGLRLCD